MNHLPALVAELLLLELVDQVHGGEEPNTPAQMLDCLEPRGRWITKVGVGKPPSLACS